MAIIPIYIMSRRNSRNSGKEPSQMAGYGSRLKARNCTKFDSKLFKIFGAITDGDNSDLFNVPLKLQKCGKGPSQMAVFGRSPKARNSCVPMVASDQRSSGKKI